jgi:hypothetical protein
MSEKDLKARVAAARAEGYTDAEIAEYLVAQGEISIAEAVKEGYTETQILDFLTTGVDPQRRLTTEPPPPPRQPGFGPGPFGGRALDTTLDVINETLLGAGEGMYNLGAMLTDPFASLFATPEQMEAARQQRRNFFAEASRNFASQERPIAREIGKVIAPAAGVSRVAKIAAPVVRTFVTRAGAPKVAQSLERVTRAVGTGGLGWGRTAAQTAALPRGQRAKQLAERMAGGGLGGGATAALMGQDLEGVGEATAFGAGLPVVASVLKRVAGFTGDITKLPRQKAAEIIRKAFGENLDEARIALANMDPNDRRLAEQVLVEAGVEPDTVYGLGRIAQEQLQPPGVNPMRVALEEDEAARLARLGSAAGGLTQEEVRAAARGGRHAVSSQMGPLREGAFARTAEVSDAEVLAARARQLASEARAAGAQATDEARRLTGASTYFGDSPAFVRGADAAADRAAIAGRTEEEQAAFAREMEDFVHRAAAEGVAPLRGAPLVAALRQMAGEAGTRVDDLQRGTLTGLADKIERAMDQNGMVNPYDMYQIRKTGLNDLIGEFQAKITAGNAPPSGNLQRTSMLVGDVEKLIDDALGPSFKEYLGRSSKGYAAVNRQELAGEALRLYEEAPSDFLKLVAGNRPQVVSKFMGGGPEKETIAGAFAGDPARHGAIQTSAQELIDLGRMNTLRTSGAPAAGALLRASKSNLGERALAAATMSSMPSLRIGAVGAEETVKNLMTPFVQREIARAYTSGPAMRGILNTFRSKARISEQVSHLPAQVRNLIAQSIINRPPAQPMIGEGALNEYDEYGNPLFDERGNYIGPRR